MDLSSPAFEAQEKIPEKHTCDGEDVSPALEIADMPDAAKSLALIVDDPDAPAKTWVHWILYDIAPTARIEENSAPGTQGQNDFGKFDYGGPCPPSGTHRYSFKVYGGDEEFGVDE